jgi:hypothetical protein
MKHQRRDACRSEHDAGVSERWRAAGASSPAASRCARSLLVAAGLCALAAAPSALAAAEEPTDPDWPCIQRLVTEIAASQMWAGPSPERVEHPSSRETERAELAHRLASRSLPIDEAEAAIARFAEGLAPEERSGQLALLFEEVLQLINQERSRVIAGIKRYTRKQRQLADKIALDSRQLADVQPGTTPDAATQELLEARQWDLRVFEDRQRVLRQVCEQPVLLEQRAFALSRAMQSELERN